MPAVIIGIAIIAYTGFLIYRQVKNVKAGNFCGNCSGCGSAKNCDKYKE